MLGPGVQGKIREVYTSPFLGEVKFQFGKLVIYIGTKWCGIDAGSSPGSQKS